MKYILVLLLALDFASGFAGNAAELNGKIAAVKIYLATKASASPLAGFDMETLKKEANVRELRQEIICLTPEELRDVVNDSANQDFFNSSMGISLIYGWLLNQFKGEPITPFYVGKYFDFEEMLRLMCDKLPEDNPVKQLINSKLDDWADVFNDDPFLFLFNGLIPLHYAIQQAANTGRLSSPFKDVKDLFGKTLSPLSPEQRKLDRMLWAFKEIRDKRNTAICDIQIGKEKSSFYPLAKRAIKLPDFLPKDYTDENYPKDKKDIRVEIIICLANIHFPETTFTTVLNEMISGRDRGNPFNNITHKGTLVNFKKDNTRYKKRREALKEAYAAVLEKLNQMKK